MTDHPQFMLNLWDHLKTRTNLENAPADVVDSLRDVYLRGARALILIPYQGRGFFSQLEQELETYRKLVLADHPHELVDLELIPGPRHLSHAWLNLKIDSQSPLEQSLFFSGARDMLHALVHDHVDKDMLHDWLEENG